MKTVYIAGPFRADNSWDMEQNIRAAESAALDVAALGAAPICPHSQNRFFQGTLADQKWLDITLEILSRTDAVFVVGDYRRSVGTMTEIAQSIQDHRPVFHKIKDFAEWLESQN